MWTSKKMSFSLCFGIVLIIIGIIVIITRPDVLIIENLLQSKLPLLNGTLNYDIWKSVDMDFKVYIFHVLNPDDIQNKGDVASLVEYGPYVYDVRLERIVIRVNESADTIEYVARRTLFFNATKSKNYSDTDEITILNPAYVGTILTIRNLAAAFLPSLGNNIPLLFPGTEGIFVRGKVRDILFDGLPLLCDPDVHPELTMICGVLEFRRPPILRTTSDQGVYAYSFFHKMNGTIDGPFTISRGLKDRYTVGHTTEFKGSPYAEYWREKECCVVKGSDSIFWAPLRSRKPILYSFIPDFCSSIQVRYKDDRIYNGLLGYNYRTIKSVWNASESSCYCPRVDGEMKCLLPGLLDLEKCQEAPVIKSEPHFLHADSGVFSILQGLNPDEDKHAAYVVVEPLTGIPLSGSRKMQLNIMLEQQPVDLLSNVTQGVFPLLWIDEGLTPDGKLLEPIILLHRLARLLTFFISIPFILGIIFVIYSYWMNTLTKADRRTSRRITILAPKNTPN